MKTQLTSPRSIIARMHTAREKYWPLLKSLQTGLLLATGLAGFMSSRCPVMHWTTLLGLTGSLLLAISGSTVLNMWYDRDIDAKMKRTCWRPLPSGKVTPGEALLLGLALSALGVGWALGMDIKYGVIVFAGLFFDVIIYTIWLKRRTAWSVLWGGISGGMPVLAGRVLGLGELDWVGAALSLSVLFWIPTHMLTFSMRYHEDYQAARIPTFPAVYGFRATRLVIAISSVLQVIALGAAALGIGMEIGYLRLIGVLSCGLLLFALRSAARPTERVNFRLFKFASIYMLSTMLLLVLEAL